MLVSVNFFVLEDEKEGKAFIERRRRVLPVYYGARYQKNKADGHGRIATMQKDIADEAQSQTTGKRIKLEANIESHDVQIHALHRHYYENAFVVDVEMSTLNLRLLQEDIEIQNRIDSDDE